MLKLKLQYFGHLWEELTHLKRPWCWERFRAGGEGDDRGWAGCMASPTRGTWVWASSRNWWWTGSLASCSLMGSDTTERLNWLTDPNMAPCVRQRSNALLFYFTKNCLQDSIWYRGWISVIGRGPKWCMLIGSLPEWQQSTKHTCKYFLMVGEICNPEVFQMLSRSCCHIMLDISNEKIAAR